MIVPDYIIGFKIIKENMVKTKFSIENRMKI